MENVIEAIIHLAKMADITEEEIIELFKMMFEGEV